MNGNPPVLVASDLPAQCVEEELWEIFSGFGPVLEVLKKSDGPSSSPFYALITFANDMEGSNALRHLNGMMFYGKPFK